MVEGEDRLDLPPMSSYQNQLVIAGVHVVSHISYAADQLGLDIMSYDIVHKIDLFIWPSRKPSRVFSLSISIYVYFT